MAAKIEDEQHQDLQCVAQSNVQKLQVTSFHPPACTEAETKDADDDITVTQKTVSMFGYFDL